MFPLIYLGAGSYTFAFSKVFFMFLIIELVLLVFLLRAAREERIILPKSKTAGILLVYILFLFLAALQGTDFNLSFWSSHFRLTGIVTWIFYFVLFLVLSASLTRDTDWRWVFRSIAASGAILAGVSILGRAGLTTGILDFLATSGGSLFGNSTISGLYYVLVFFLGVIGVTLESNKYWRVFYGLAGAVVFFSPELFNFSNWPAFLGEARASSLVLRGGILVTMLLGMAHKILDARRSVLAVSLLIFCMLSGVAFGFFSVLNGTGKINDIYVRESGYARPIVWDMAVEGIKAKPLLGYGPENFTYVFQSHLDPELTVLEKFSWFDRAHNFILDQVVTTGILGTLLMFIIFLVVCLESFKAYSRDRKFYFLLIPVILFFHFLQMQTSFETYGSLLLVFILLAFLTSQQYEKFSFKVKSARSGRLLALILVVVTTWGLIIRPVAENHLVAKVRRAGTFEKRAELYPKLSGLIIYPPNVLRFLSTGYMQAIMESSEAKKSPGAWQKIKAEIEKFVSLHQGYYERYNGNYKYLTNYALFLVNAYAFEFDELDRAEELAKEAIDISASYPHPFWVLAVSRYYQEDLDSALDFAERAYQINPTAEESKSIYQAVKNRIDNPTQSRQFLYLPGL